MKDTKWFILYCLTITGFLFFLFANRCSQEKSCKQDLQTNWVLKETKHRPGDSIPYEVKVTVPIPYYVDRLVPIPAKLDTLELLKEYFSKYAYCDSIKVDSSFLAIIKDTISQNKIISRKFFLQNLRPTAIINTYKTEQEQARKFYVGPVFGLGHDRRFAAGLSLMYISKTERPIAYSYDAVNKMHLGSVYFRLK